MLNHMLGNETGQASMHYTQGGNGDYKRALGS